MPRFLNHINLNQNQLQNAVIHQIAGADAATPAVGQVWFNTTAGSDGQGRIKVKLGTRTMVLDDQYVTGVTAGGTPNGIVIGGTALAPTVSMSLASGSASGAMSTTQYNQLANATNAATASTLVVRDSSGNAAFNQLTISNAPVNSTDAVNKAYADALAAGFDPKASCVLATTVALPACAYANGTAGVGATLTASANQALTTTLIDGTSAYTLAVNDRVLVKNQAAPAQNGIYVVTNLGSGSTKWVLTRATDYNTSAIGPYCITQGSLVPVEQGTNTATLWLMVTYGTITVGTTDLVFSQIGSAQVYTNGNGISMAANTVSVNLTGTSTLEFNAGALRLKSSSTAGQVLLSGGTGAEPSYGQVNLASAVTGTLPKANGGTGQDNTSVSQNLLWASPNGSTGAASYRALVAADLPTSGVTAGTYIKTTVDTYGRVTAGASLAATDIPVLDMAKISTGILGTTQGGTGLNLASIKDFPGIQRIPVRVVATSNITLATPGATIDGVSLVANDRILLSAQSTASQNGIWVWNGASSALTRPTDYPAAGTVHAFYGVWVEVLQGTTNAGTSWYISTTGAITIDTTSVTWTVASTNLSNGITGLVPLSNGGTGASSAATARTNLGAAGSATAVITGDGTTTSFNVNHGLASAKVVAKVSDPTANNEDVYPNIQYTDTNNAAIIFSVAPANGVVYNVRCSG